MMDMKTVKIVVFFLFVGSVCGVLGHRYAENKHRDLYVNHEALTTAENGNEWESNYQYCRCKDKDDDNVKTCVAGNALSLRPSCKKEVIGVPLYCRNLDENCQ